LGQPDVIFIFGATNDSWAGAPIGDYKYENITKADLYQFTRTLCRIIIFQVKDKSWGIRQ
ncbi:MAG: hypothetical protein II567_03775, partial [Candidatus Riflebacteria bacterium]|nr:hypothetical protein [Candidatus Riflebacteria bacterium]